MSETNSVHDEEDNLFSPTFVTIGKSALLESMENAAADQQSPRMAASTSTSGAKRRWSLMLRRSMNKSTRSTASNPTLDTAAKDPNEHSNGNNNMSFASTTDDGHAHPTFADFSSPLLKPANSSPTISSSTVPNSTTHHQQQSNTGNTAFQFTQSSPTNLPDELLELIREFRNRVEKIAAAINAANTLASTLNLGHQTLDAETVEVTQRMNDVHQLHHCCNNIIRYVTGFLVTKYDEEQKHEQQRLLGWAMQPPAPAPAAPLQPDHAKPTHPASSHKNNKSAQETGVDSSSSPPQPKHIALPLLKVPFIPLSAQGKLLDDSQTKFNLSPDVLGPFLLSGLYAVLESSLAQLRCDRARIFLPDGTVLRAVVSVGGGAVLTPAKAEFSRTLAGAVYRSGIAINVCDATKAPPHLSTTVAEHESGYHVRNALCFPLPKPDVNLYEKAIPDVSSVAYPPVPPSSRPGTQSGVTAGASKASRHREQMPTFGTGGGPLTAAAMEDLEAAKASDGGPVCCGVIEFVNKVKSTVYAQGFTPEDESAAHQIALIVSSLLKWGESVNLCNNTALEAGAKLQALVISQRHYSSSIRSLSIGGSKQITRTEAQQMIAQQALRDDIIGRRVDAAIAVHHPITRLAEKSDHQQRTFLYRVASGPSEFEQAVEKRERETDDAVSNIARESVELVQRGGNLRELIETLQQTDSSWKTSRRECILLQQRVDELQFLLNKERASSRHLVQLCESCGILPNADIQQFRDSSDNPRPLTDDEVDAWHAKLREDMRKGKSQATQLSTRLAKTCRKEIHDALDTTDTSPQEAISLSIQQMMDRLNQYERKAPKSLGKDTTVSSSSNLSKTTTLSSSAKMKPAKPTTAVPVHPFSASAKSRQSAQLEREARVEGIIAEERRKMFAAYNEQMAIRNEKEKILAGQ